MKKSKIYLSLFIIGFAIALFLGTYIVVQLVEKKINSDMVHLQQMNVELQNDCDEFQKQINQCKNNNEEMMAKIEEQRQTVAEGWQPFFGGWGVFARYLSGEEIDKYADVPFISMTEKYIYIDGSFLTKKPVYDIAVRTKEDVLKKLESVGIKTEDAVNLLPWECYIEMSFSESYNKDVIPKHLRCFVETAKYYIIDNDTMLCVSTSDGERLDILYREIY